MRRGWTAAVLLVLGLAVPAVSAAQIMVVGSSVQEREAGPGERYSGQIRIRNQGSDPQAVRVYQTDYFFRADGTNLYSEPGTQRRSNAGWLTVAPTDLVLEGGQEAEIGYEVSVPADPSLRGTYWSMVMVEPADAPGDPALDPSQAAVGVRATVRFGIQVATHIRGEVEHRLQVGNPQVVLDGAGDRHLQFELVNDGEVGYRPNVSLELYDQTGGLTATMDSQRGLIYPGTSALQRFDLGALPAGSYQAVVVVDTGALQVFGAQFNLAIGATG